MTGIFPYIETMRVWKMTIIAGLLLPQLAWASDYSGLLPLYIAFCIFIGGIAGSFEWMIINAIMDRGERAGEEDREAQNKSRFGCGLGVVLWIVNSAITHFVIMFVWG